MSSEAKWMVYEDLLFSVIGLNSMIVLKILLGILFWCLSSSIVETVVNLITKIRKWWKEKKNKVHDEDAKIEKAVTRPIEVIERLVSKIKNSSLLF